MSLVDELNGFHSSKTSEIHTRVGPFKNSDKPKEIDPNGLQSNQPGAKLDSGKPMCAQVLGQFARALWEVSKVGTFGANKYSIGGWQHVENGQNRYDDAGMRHWLKEKMGESVDPDSQMFHLAQDAWNALAVLELYLREVEGNGDRP